MKRISIIMIFLMVGLVSLVSADEPMGVMANMNIGSIQFINPADNTVTEPLLVGELGPRSGGLLDVVITADGKTAIVSNFGASYVYFVDISGGFNGTPRVTGSMFTNLFAEDIALTPDEKYLLVTDGGLSSQVAIIKMSDLSVRYKNMGGKDAQAVAITADGQLALFPDYLGGAVHSYWLNDGELSYKESWLVLPNWPVNIAISPDGHTVIVPSAFRPVASSFMIDDNHDLIYMGEIPLPSRGSQSCVFSRDGSKAYILINGNFGKGTLVAVLNVTGPGQVTPSGDVIQVTPTRGSGQFFGVDTIALDPSGNYLYITNPTSFGVIAGFSVLDLTTNSEVGLFPATGIPTGIAFTTVPALAGEE
jgi:DNA-binding beta-propeller fold protein YncE